MLTATVSLPEAVLLLAALTGLLVNLWALADAIADLRALLAAGLNGRLKLIAWACVRDEAVRLTLQAWIFVSVALSACLPPISILGDAVVSDFWALWRSWGLVVLEVVLVGNVVIGRVARRRLLAAEQAARDAERRTGMG